MFGFNKKSANVSTSGQSVYVNPSKEVSKARNDARIERLEKVILNMPKNHPDYENLDREYQRRLKIRALDEED